MKKTALILLVLLIAACCKDEIIIKKHGTVLDTVKVDFRRNVFDTQRTVIYDTIKNIINDTIIRQINDTLWNVLTKYDTITTINYDTIRCTINDTITTTKYDTIKVNIYNNVTVTYYDTVTIASFQYKIEPTTIKRKEDGSSTTCKLYDTYFDFDFNKGAHFKISYNGEIQYTSNVSSTKPKIKNFSKGNTQIEFDLLDGEYSTNTYAHYTVSPLKPIYEEVVVNRYDTVHVTIMDTITTHIIVYDTIPITIVKYVSGQTTIKRTTNNNTTRCYIKDNYFNFDFEDGASFNISYNGKIMYTSNKNAAPQIKNFEANETSIEFDLLDREYSNNYAHYIISPLTAVELEPEGKIVTISSNGTQVATVVLPTAQYGWGTVKSSTISGLTVEGQYISDSKFAISIYVNGNLKEYEHKNWSTPKNDSSGKDISGTGAGGSTQYNFRSSLRQYLSN